MEMVGVMPYIPACAAAIIFPSIEYVSEEWYASDICDPEGLVVTRPPVWRSQLMSVCLRPIPTNKWLSGEKLSPPCISSWKKKVLSCLKVTASRISIVPELYGATAMNLQQGDHATAIGTEG